MDKVKYILFLILAGWFAGNSTAQPGHSNFGKAFIHDNNFQVIRSDFYNLRSGHFTIEGSVWIKGDVLNNGIIDFTTMANTPRTIKLEGETHQLINGTGTTRFYNVWFNNPSGFTLRQNLYIDNEAVLNAGVIAIPTDSIRVIFEDQAHALLVSSDCYVDGTVEKTGNNGFIFPVGDNGYYRITAIAAPEKETDRFSARYYNQNPSGFGMDTRSKNNSTLLNIEDNEFWEIRREAGNSSPEISLSWDIVTTSLAPVNPEHLVVVRWDGTQWVNEGKSSWQGNELKGVLSAEVSEYGFFTLAIIENNAPEAVPDTFYTMNTYPVQGNLLLNDSDPDGHALLATPQYLEVPEWGTFSIANDGSFSFVPSGESFGEVSFTYQVCDTFDPSLCTSGTLILYIQMNSDGDDLPDFEDEDNDDDGITNIQEGNGKVDTDLDGIPDSEDPDSDGDGVPDLIEGHILLAGNSVTLVSPLGRDTDNDGLDDSFDPDNGGHPAPLADHDADGIPDWRDPDDDDDGIPTLFELGDFKEIPLTLDTDGDGIPDYLDPDSPVLDIADDYAVTTSGSEITVNLTDNDSPDFVESSLTIVQMPSHGIILSNGDGTVTYTSDHNFTGTEIIRYEVCTESSICVTAQLEVEVLERLNVPEAMTPNGDGLNDYFVIEGLENYTDNHLIIFNRWGGKVFEVTNYQNNWGGLNNQTGSAGDEKLPAGIYYYILTYGNNEPLSGLIYLEW